MSRILAMILAILTAFLLGAQVAAFVPLPLLWGIWAVIILIVILIYTISTNGNRN